MPSPHSLGSLVAARLLPTLPQTPELGAAVTTFPYHASYTTANFRPTNMDARGTLVIKHRFAVYSPDNTSFRVASVETGFFTPHAATGPTPLFSTVTPTDKVVHPSLTMAIRAAETLVKGFQQAVREDLQERIAALQREQRQAV